jgi:tmRNA-binding protein
MLMFAWNPKGFQIGNARLCNAKGEIFMAAYYIHNIVTEIAVRHGERRERRWVVHADNAKSGAATVTRAFCNDNFSRIPSHPPSPPD